MYLEKKNIPPMAKEARDVPVAVASAAPGRRKRCVSGLPRQYVPFVAMEIKKESPARAAQLPRTLPLGGANGLAAVFSADIFSRLSLDGYLQRQLEKLGLRVMTPVQQRAIPEVLSGRDALVRSPTGSGKTLVYAVPAVQLLLNVAMRRESGQNRLAGTYVMILLPTRELTMQTYEQLGELCHPFPKIVSSTLMGGEKRKAEKARLRKGVSMVIGTPGRVSDHLQRTASFDVSQCRLLVLDEADMLLQLGFKQVNMPKLATRSALSPVVLARATLTFTSTATAAKLTAAAAAAAATAWTSIYPHFTADTVQVILSIIDIVSTRAAIGVERQTVLLSATLSSQVQELAGVSLKEHVSVNLNVAQVSTAAVATCAPLAFTDVSCRAVYAADATFAAESGKVLSAQRLEAPAELRQNFVVLSPKARLTSLAGFLRSKCVEAQPCKLLVFISSCDGVDFLYELFGQGAWPALAAARATGGHGVDEAVDQSARLGAVTDVWWDDSTDSKAIHRMKARGIAMKDTVATASADIRGTVSCASALLGTQLLRLHGKLKQQQRMDVFQCFRKLRSGVLLCTDVAARGLNLQGVHWILQFDLPQDPREYVHRIGRAARMGQVGQVYAHFVFAPAYP